MHDVASDNLYLVEKVEPTISNNEALTTDLENESIKRSPSDDIKQSFYWKASPIVSWKNLAATDEQAMELVLLMGCTLKKALICSRILHLNQ